MGVWQFCLQGGVTPKTDVAPTYQAQRQLNGPSQKSELVGAFSNSIPLSGIVSVKTKDEFKNFLLLFCRFSCFLVVISQVLVFMLQRNLLPQFPLGPFPKRKIVIAFAYHYYLFKNRKKLLAVVEKFCQIQVNWNE